MTEMLSDVLMRAVKRFLHVFLSLLLFKFELDGVVISTPLHPHQDKGGWERHSCVGFWRKKYAISYLLK